jgi:hypothetical protein
MSATVSVSAYSTASRRGMSAGAARCLKVRGLAGGSLTRAEADFAGPYEPKRPSGGWHCPTSPRPGMDDDEPSADEDEFLRGLMAVGQDQLEFLAENDSPQIRPNPQRP